MDVEIAGVGCDRAAYLGLVLSGAHIAASAGGRRPFSARATLAVDADVLSMKPVRGGWPVKNRHRDSGGPQRATEAEASRRTTDRPHHGSACSALMPRFSRVVRIGHRPGLKIGDNMLAQRTRPWAPFARNRRMAGSAARWHVTRPCSGRSRNNPRCPLWSSLISVLVPYGPTATHRPDPQDICVDNQSDRRQDTSLVSTSTVQAKIVFHHPNDV